MFLMIYAQLRLLYFYVGTIQQEDSGAGGANPGAALHWCSDREQQTLTNRLYETTAIDIYHIPPQPTTVSTMFRSPSLFVFFTPFVFIPIVCMGDARDPFRSSLLKAHPLVPWGRGVGGRRWEGDGEGIRSDWKLQALWRNTLLCVFTCLVDEVSYSQHDLRKKKRFFTL